jgi:hypothetical protein
VLDQPSLWLSRLQRQVRPLQHWQMPTRSNPFPGTDGAQWVVEARRDGWYHVVGRWSGTDGLDSVGKLSVDLATLPLLMLGTAPPPAHECQGHACLLRRRRFGGAKMQAVTTIGLDIAKSVSRSSQYARKCASRRAIGSALPPRSDV